LGPDQDLEGPFVTGGRTPYEVVRFLHRRRHFPYNAPAARIVASEQSGEETESARIEGVVPVRGHDRARDQAAFQQVMAGQLRLDPVAGLLVGPLRAVVALEHAQVDLLHPELAKSEAGDQDGRLGAVAAAPAPG